MGQFVTWDLFFDDEALCMLQKQTKLVPIIFMPICSLTVTENDEIKIWTDQFIIISWGKFILSTRSYIGDNKVVSENQQNKKRKVQIKSLIPNQLRAFLK